MRRNIFYASESICFSTSTRTLKPPTEKVMLTIRSLVAKSPMANARKIKMMVTMKKRLQ